MAAAMGGLDALAFTGGVGERSASVRDRAVAGLGFLGLAVDPGRNETAVVEGVDAVVTAPGGGPQVLVVHAREDAEIARQVRSLLA